MKPSAPTKLAFKLQPAFLSSTLSFDSSGSESFKPTPGSFSVVTERRDIFETNSFSPGGGFLKWWHSSGMSQTCVQSIVPSETYVCIGSDCSFRTAISSVNVSGPTVISPFEKYQMS